MSLPAHTVFLVVLCLAALAVSGDLLFK